MREIQEQGAPYPWYVPINVPDNEQSTANFKIQVSDPITTIKSYMIGTNIQHDSHLLSELQLANYEIDPDHPNDPPIKRLILTPQTYAFIIYLDKTAVTLYNKIKVVVNNLDNDFTYDLEQHSDTDIYYLIDTNYYGDGNQNKTLPVEFTLIDSTNNSTVVFGDDDDYGEDNTPHNQLSTSFINLRKDLFTFDFGMQPEQ